MRAVKALMCKNTHSLNYIAIACMLQRVYCTITIAVKNYTNSDKDKAKFQREDGGWWILGICALNFLFVTFN